jgi:hypothetical protein
LAPRRKSRSPEVVKLNTRGGGASPGLAGADGAGHREAGQRAEKHLTVNRLCKMLILGGFPKSRLLGSQSKTAAGCARVMATPKTIPTILLGAI